jgi:RNA polymerase sigma factor (sigma-70 family)
MEFLPEVVSVMPADPIHTLVPRLRELVSAPSSQASDRELLCRFRTEHDEAAFAEIVRRHAPMLLRVGQRVLHSAHDAEDIVQAAFLLLAQKAASIRWHDSLAGWLFQTIYHLSLNARIAAKRRAHHESQAKPAPLADPLADLTVRELQTALDEELGRLPEKFRSPILLCCLEGRSRDEAAACLGWSLAKVKDRLERGREHLRSRLARRGVLLGTALTSTWLLEGGALAGLSPHAIAKDALSIATGQASLAVLLPPHVAALARGGTTPMLTCKGAILLATLALALGIAAAVPNPSDKTPPAPVQADQAKATPGEVSPPQPKTLPLIGHKGAVRALAFAPDGKTIATSGADKTIRIWNVASGAQKHKMAHAWDKEGRPTDNLEWTAVALGVAYSPDGKTFATHSTGRYGWLVFWDAIKGLGTWSTCRNQDRLREEGGAVAYSPDGKLIVAGFGGGYTMVFENRRLGKELGRIKGPTGRATVAISPSSKLLAIGGGGSIQLVDLPTGRVLRDPLGLRGKNAITAMSFFRGATRLVAADGGKGLRILDPATGKEERAFNSGDAVIALAASADGRRLATAGVSGTVVLWNCYGGQERRFSAGGPVNALAFSPDGKRLAAAGTEGAVVWDLTRDDKPLPPDFKLSAKELDALWSDLAGDDGGKVYTTMRFLRADPARSQPFLQKRLAPTDTGPDPKKVKQLIADLDSDEFKTRETAMKELETLGPDVEPTLRDALAAHPSLEVVRRLERLLTRLEEQRQTLTAERHRDVRAVRVMEQVGTAEARKLLEVLSKKGPGWWVKREAAEALRRLGRSQPKR